MGGRGPASVGACRGGRSRGGTRRGECMGGRRGSMMQRAYGVAVTFPPQKGGAVPESERRRAAWRTTETSHTCLCFLLCCLISSSLSHLGGAGVGGEAGAGVRCGAVRAVVCLASCCVCLRLFLLTTRSSKKKQEAHYRRKRGRPEFYNQTARRKSRSWGARPMLRAQRCSGRYQDSSSATTVCM